MFQRQAFAPVSHAYLSSLPALAICSPIKTLCLSRHFDLFPGHHLSWLHDSRLSNCRMPSMPDFSRNRQGRQLTRLLRLHLSSSSWRVLRRHHNVDFLEPAYRFWGCRELTRRNLSHSTCWRIPSCVRVRIVTLFFRGKKTGRVYLRGSLSLAKSLDLP